MVWVFTKNNGEIFVGNFREGKANGEGIKYLSGGVAFNSGWWEDGALVKPYLIDTSKLPIPPK